MKTKFKASSEPLENSRFSGATSRRSAIRSRRPVQGMSQYRFSGRAIRAATLLGLAECLRFGTTSVSDMYYFSDTICQCVSEVCIKGNISRCVTVFEDDYCFDKGIDVDELDFDAEDILFYVDD